ncbi:MAG: hypothetical protein KA248_01270, partial [Kiritimatiellae bacterium]|nr:hypothetical protein [Kiritimatiellia bacterium]
ENSDVKKIERALQRLHDVAHARPLREDGRHILIFNLRPWYTHLAHEGILAARLRYAGHHVSYYTCLHDLTFCMRHNMNAPESIRVCHGAQCLAKKRWMDSRFPLHSLGPMSAEAADQCRRIDALGLEDWESYAWRGLAIGSLCASSMFWYFRRTHFTEADVATLRQFLKTAVHVADCFDVFLETNRPDVVLLYGGAHFTEAVVVELCRRRGVRSVTWAQTWNELFIAAQDKSTWASLDLERFDLAKAQIPAEILQKGRDLLAFWKKKHGYQGFIFWEKQNRQASDAGQVIRGDPRPFAVAYTNTTFETGILRKKRIWNDQFEWSVSLVEYFRRHPEYRLIIRVHPAEAVKDEYRVGEWYLDRMKDYVRDWPENVTIIPPESPVSSYELAYSARVALTYVSTIAMELAWQGVPVITAGHCHYVGRGFSCDPEDEAAYHRALDRYLAERQAVTDDMVSAVERYIAWLIYVRLVEFEPLELGRRESYLRCRKIKPRQVFSGKLAGLEAVCSLILDGREWWRLDQTGPAEAAAS